MIKRNEEDKMETVPGCYNKQETDNIMDCQKQIIISMVKKTKEPILVKKIFTYVQTIIN